MRRVAVEQQRDKAALCRAELANRQTLEMLAFYRRQPYRVLPYRRPAVTSCCRCRDTVRHARAQCAARQQADGARE